MWLTVRHECKSDAVQTLPLVMLKDEYCNDKPMYG